MSYYDLTAAGYNELHGEEQARKLAIIKARIKPKAGSTLLDVGCGTGLSSDFKCRVTGIDPSKELLKQNPHNCVEGSAEAIPFQDRSFDYVISVTACHNFKNLKKAFSEIRRVAKGIVVITVLKRSAMRGRIEARLNEIFKINERVDEGTDIIYFMDAVHAI